MLQISNKNKTTNAIGVYRLALGAMSVLTCLECSHTFALIRTHQHARAHICTFAHIARHTRGMAHAHNRDALLARIATPDLVGIDVPPPAQP